MSEEEKKAVEWFKEDLTKEKEEMRYYNEYKKQVIKRNENLLNLIEKQQKEIKELQKDKEVLIKNYDKALGTFICKDKIREIRDKAEVMDYYSLNDVIDDLSKLIGDYEDE